jgi:small-conductance mechanosensitive channel
MGGASPPRCVSSDGEDRHSLPHQRGPQPESQVRTSLAHRRLFRVALQLFAAVASSVGCAAGAQTTGARSTGAPAASMPRPGAHDTTPAGAPVVLGVDTLFRLYGSLGPFTPESRATSASARFHDMAAALAGGDSIVVTDRDAFSELSTGGVVLMTVLDADAAPTGTARPALARQYAVRARTAAVADAARTGTHAIVEGAALAIAATVVLLLLLRLIAIGFPRLHQRIEALRRVRLPAVRIQNFELLSAGRLSGLLLALARVLRIVLVLLLLYLYVPLVLSFFPWTAPLSHRIVGYALRPFVAAWDGFVTYLPNLFYLAAGVIIVRYVLSFLRLVFDALGSGALTIKGFYRDWSEPTYKILRVFVLAFSVTLLYPYLPGASSDAFKGVSIFLGVLFSLGSSAAIGNMVAGVMLTYTRAFQLGDRVQIGETVGDVTEKTLIVTRLRTIKNAVVTIPNGVVLSSLVENFTTLAASHGLVLHTSVTIGYDAPWRRVHELLIDAARRTAHVLPEPAPFVLQTSLDDFYVSYQLNAYTNRADVMATTYSHLHENIQEAFNAAEVEIMSPHYSALRDGNQTTTPPAHLSARYRAPAFRVETGSQEHSATKPE